MKSLYLRAGIITGLVAAIIGSGFYLWRSKTLSSDKAEKILLLEKLEQQGLIDFSTTDIRGRKFNLSDFKGTVVVLNFWASWCSPCVEELPSLVKLVEEFKGKVKLIAISADSSESEMTDFMKAFPQMNHPDIYVALDDSKKILKQFEVEKLPESFVADPNLKLVKKIVGTINWHTPDSIEYIKGILTGSHR